MHETIDLLLTLLTIGQIVTGAISWYFGLQVKMLRLELVNKETCEKHCNTFQRDLTKLSADVAEIRGAVRRDDA